MSACYRETNECNDDDNINNIILYFMLWYQYGWTLRHKAEYTKRHFITIALNARRRVNYVLAVLIAIACTSSLKSAEEKYGFGTCEIHFNHKIIVVFR